MAKFSSVKNQQLQIHLKSTARRLKFWTQLGVQTGQCSQMHINIGFGLDKARPTLRFWLSQNHSLNVIENLWTMLKSRVRLGGQSFHPSRTAKINPSLCNKFFGVFFVLLLEALMVHAVQSFHSIKIRVQRNH